MPITQEPFGRFWNGDVTLYTLENRNGLKVRITDYGAIITELHAPGKDGLKDIILGFDNLADYLKGHPFFGAIAGRSANRIPNGRFEIDGNKYELNVNAPMDNHLHGGYRGFDKYIWEAETRDENGVMSLILHRISPDREEHYPGTLDTIITYTLDDNDVLTFDVVSTTDKPTIVNIVQHSYINMAGHDSGDIKGHELTIHGDQITPTNDKLIPTGEYMDVEGTAYDFRKATVIGDAMSRHDSIFDINYVLRGEDDGMHPCARLRDPESGRTLTMTTNQPGVQFYDGHKVYDQEQYGKGNYRYPASAGLCLETQQFPNAVNTPNFPSPVLRPGETYHHVTTFTFTVE